MKQEQFEVLKAINDATSRMDLNAFAQKVNLSPDQAIRQIQELAREGFLQKVGSGYGINEKGKLALKALSPVSYEMGFHFYLDIDKPLGLTTLTLKEFYNQVKQVYSDSLEFHLYRGDFEKWISDVLKDPQLASTITEVKIRMLRGEILRKELLKVIDAKYNVEELT